MDFIDIDTYLWGRNARFALITVLSFDTGTAPGEAPGPKIFCSAQERLFLVQVPKNTLCLVRQQHLKVLCFCA
ncbi:hypothetical protein V5799_002220 [Amblyomma americanum]|uniref:Uncharacterized protein n=1 Tax=Amblyomma americanum TaxID=6943 RepID=A0AAQ4CXY9_AMBAM